MATSLTHEEAQRYDRQVRIWGAEAQLRLQSSKVLIAGLRGLNVEVTKNLVLMGVNVTLQDSTTATFDDLGHNFFITEADVGQNLAYAMIEKVKELNSFANVSFTDQVLSKASDIFFLDFDIILYGGWSETEAVRINDLCRSKSPHIGFFWSGVFGNESWFISDFGALFSYKDDPPKDKEIKTSTSYSLREILAKKWSELIAKRVPMSKTYVKSRILSKFRDDFGRYDITPEDMTSITSIAKELLTVNGLDNDLESTSKGSLTSSNLEELCRVAGSISVLPCSVLGSFLAQEVVKCISRSGFPSSCVFMFEGSSFEVRSYPNTLVV